MAEAIYLSLKVSTFGIEGHTENRTSFFNEEGRGDNTQEKCALSGSAAGTRGTAGELHLTCEELDKFIFYVIGTFSTIQQG